VDRGSHSISLSNSHPNTSPLPIILPKIYSGTEAGEDVPLWAAIRALATSSFAPCTAEGSAARLLGVRSLPWVVVACVLRTAGGKGASSRAATKVRSRPPIYVFATAAGASVLRPDASRLRAGEQAFAPSMVVESSGRSTINPSPSEGYLWRQMRQTFSKRMKPLIFV